MNFSYEREWMCDFVLFRFVFGTNSMSRKTEGKQTIWISTHRLLCTLYLRKIARLIVSIKREARWYEYPSSGMDYGIITNNNTESSTTRYRQSVIIPIGRLEYIRFVQKSLYRLPLRRCAACCQWSVVTHSLHSLVRCRMDFFSCSLRASAR